MADVIDIASFRKKTEDSTNVDATDNEYEDMRIITPELIQDYSDTLLLAVAHLDLLDKKDTDSCFWLVVKFNHLLMRYIEEELKGE